MSTLETRVGLGGAPSFLDSRSWTRFELVTPFEQPALWKSYLDGAVEAYRRHDVEVALELDNVANGLSTTLFVIGRDPDGRCLAGVRIQGPFRHAEETHIMKEFAGSPGEELVRDTITARLGEGVLEAKAGWVRHDHPQRDALSDAVARAFVHVMRWLGCRYGMCSAALFAAKRWETSGARFMEDLEPVPYPSDKYETGLLWWDLERIELDATAPQFERLEIESVQIERTAPRVLSAA